MKMERYVSGLARFGTFIFDSLFKPLVVKLAIKIKRAV